MVEAWFSMHMWIVGGREEVPTDGLGTGLLSLASCVAFVAEDPELEHGCCTTRQTCCSQYGC